MKEEELIKKWLDGKLTPEELEEFKSMDSYSSYAKISDYAKRFKAPNFNESESLEALNQKIETKSSKTNTLKWIASIAAVFVVVFTVFNFFNTSDTVKSFDTGIASTETIHLPDRSIVNLSSNTHISFDEKRWDGNRTLNLKGEAHFEVMTGETFTVKTKYGSVEVLGTQFNVKSRDYGFEVTCYEGSVKVKIDNKQSILTQTESLTVKGGSMIKSKTELTSPDWKSNSTVLKSKSLAVVLEEFKNYYDVTFDTSKIDTSRLYTGSFNHNDIDIALKSITLPLDLTYQIKNKKVILSSK
jgi:ferric-dicitrate binding protein FerR (iron transport regulator)